MNLNIDLNIKLSKEALDKVAEILKVMPKIEFSEAKTNEDNGIEVEKAPKDITLEAVRGKLASLSQNGKQAEVKALITEFGANKLSEIPKEKYPELLKKAEVL
jgi:hypothetical protein